MTFDPNAGITDPMLRAVCDGLPETFDSHAVIRAIMRLHPQAYVVALHSHVDNHDPFVNLHASIGKRLHGFATSIGRVKSMNIRGEETMNEHWQR